MAAYIFDAYFDVIALAESEVRWTVFEQRKLSLITYLKFSIIKLDGPQISGLLESTTASSSELSDRFSLNEWMLRLSVCRIIDR